MNVLFGKMTVDPWIGCIDINLFALAQMCPGAPESTIQVFGDESSGLTDTEKQVPTV